MANKELATVGDVLWWSYANLAMAHAAVERGDGAYGRLHYMIRARLFAGLRKGTMDVGSLVDDERLKPNLPQACSYCAVPTTLVADHLLAKCRGGPETGDNIVWACRTCNSSKGACDVFEWYQKRDEFPPLYLIRRYLKLAIEWSSANAALGVPLKEAEMHRFPFSVEFIPTTYPPPGRLRMWVTAG